MKENNRYRNSDRIKDLDDERKCWWFDDYYSGWEDEDEDHIYYELIDTILYEPNILYWVIDMNSIYSASVIRDRKIESLLNPKKRVIPTFGDLIKN